RCKSLAAKDLRGKRPIQGALAVPKERRGSAAEAGKLQKLGVTSGGVRAGSSGQVAGRAGRAAQGDARGRRRPRHRNEWSRPPTSVHLSADEGGDLEVH